MAQIKELPQLGFQEALRLAWSKVTQFRGRSRRSEFWWVALAGFIASFVCNFIPLIGAIAQFLIMLAMIPVSFRRLHDTGHSGWWYGLAMIASTVYTSIISYNMFSSIIGMSDNADVDPEQLLSGMAAAFSNPVCIVALLCSMVFGIACLIFFCMDSKVEPNKYGESPKYVLDNN